MRLVVWDFGGFEGWNLFIGDIVLELFLVEIILLIVIELDYNNKRDISFNILDFLE